MSLGVKVRELRKNLGLTQQKLADEVGVPRPYISRLERGRFKKPSADLMLRVAKALKVKVFELFEAAGYIGERSKGEKRRDYLKLLSLLSPEHQYILELLAREFARIERWQW